MTTLKEIWDAIPSWACYAAYCLLLLWLVREPVSEMFAASFDDRMEKEEHQRRLREISRLQLEQLRKQSEKPPPP